VCEHTRGHRWWVPHSCWWCDITCNRRGQMMVFQSMRTQTRQRAAKLTGHLRGHGGRRALLESSVRLIGSVSRVTRSKLEAFDTQCVKSTSTACTHRCKHCRPQRILRSREWYCCCITYLMPCEGLRHQLSSLEQGHVPTTAVPPTREAAVRFLVH
jgi:hypothetical protein